MQSVDLSVAQWVQWLRHKLNAQDTGVRCAFQRVQIGPAASPASCQIGTEGSCPEKWPEPETDF
jgi:hypothetical protein